MAGNQDMNGIWSGMYNYDNRDHTVKFTAWLDEKAFVLGGSILEPNTILAGGPDELSATIEGGRAGLSIDFAKTYDKSLGLQQPPVLYEGEANSDFTEVRGIWHFGRPHDHKGQFRLIRMAEGVMHKLARARSAEVDI